MPSLMEIHEKIVIEKLVITHDVSNKVDYQIRANRTFSIWGWNYEEDEHLASVNKTVSFWKTM